MKSVKTETKLKVKDSHFSVTAFLPVLGMLLLIAGIHAGLVVLFLEQEVHSAAQAALICGYWILVSAGLTEFIHHQMKKNYEIPMKDLAKAANKVANGDFSVYAPPLHPIDRYDYLDVMIVDFNRMVEELGSIETLKTDFLSNVSHEIKTPIAVIQNSAEMLQSTELSEEQRQEYVLAVIKSSKKLSALITNILKLNKLEKQNIKPVMEAYDLCSQLCECSLQFEDIWEKKQIEFEVQIEERKVISLDQSLLELVWTNLLSNAFKFTQECGSVTLRQYSGEDTVTVQVADTGCGMDQKTMEHIFDKFYQGDTSHAAEGNGLGLALAFRIVKMLDGNISVESEAGKGTCFTVELPAAAE